MPHLTLLVLPGSTIQYSPEEVLGMVLNYSRSLAEEFAGLPRLHGSGHKTWLSFLGGE